MLHGITAYISHGISSVFYIDFQNTCTEFLSRAGKIDEGSLSTSDKETLAVLVAELKQYVDGGKFSRQV